MEKKTVRIPNEVETHLEVNPLIVTSDIHLESKRSTWFVVPLLFFILLAVVLSLPYVEQPKGNYGISSMEQSYIGMWPNSDITFTFADDHAYVAKYKNTTYNGWWYYDFFSVKIKWSNVLQ